MKEIFEGIFGGDMYVVEAGEVKAASDKGLVAGLLVPFTDVSDPDKSKFKDYFTKSTDFDIEDWDGAKSSVYYHHGLDKTMGKKRLTKGEIKMTDAGVWIEAQLDMADAYQNKLFGAIKEGKMGWSSGTAAHLVERETKAGGTHWVSHWPLGLDASITPTPAKHDNTVLAIKSFAEMIEELDTPHGGGLKFSEEFDQALGALERLVDRATEIKALRDEKGQLTSSAFKWRMGRIADQCQTLIAEMEPIPGAPDIQATLERYAAINFSKDTAAYGY